MIQLVPIVLAQVALFAGGHVNISCHNLTKTGYDGLAWKSERRVQINDPLCLSVNQFASDHVLRSTSFEALSSSENDPAWGMLTIIHESEHIRHPHATETQVNCAALRRVAGFAMTLGASEQTAQEVVRDDARWISSQPSQYRRGCLKIRHLR